MSSEYYIEADIHTTGTHHEGGYCSDPYDFCDIDRHATETIDVPNKNFIDKYCDSDGEIDYDGMRILSSIEHLCNGSGYCGCEVKNNVTRATLQKRRNIKQQFMVDDSSAEESTSYTKKAASSGKKAASSGKKAASPTKKAAPPAKKAAPLAKKEKSKDVQPEKSHETVFAPVNAFRGRINSTYTATPNWYLS